MNNPDLLERQPVFVDISYESNYVNRRLGIASEEDRPWISMRNRCPPQPGWYNASEMGSIFAFRYWDGVNWSIAVSAVSASAEDKGRWLRQKGLIVANPVRDQIRWRNVKPYLPGEEWDFLRE